jgi:hypothetical protein
MPPEEGLEMIAKRTEEVSLKIFYPDDIEYSVLVAQNKRLRARIEELESALSGRVQPVLDLESTRAIADDNFHKRVAHHPV